VPVVVVIDDADRLDLDLARALIRGLAGRAWRSGARSHRPVAVAGRSERTSEAQVSRRRRTRSKASTHLRRAAGISDRDMRPGTSARGPSRDTRLMSWPAARFSHAVPGMGCRSLSKVSAS
jgi:hypothetical protein